MFGRLLLACFLALGVTSSVLADWEPGDPEFPNPKELGDRLWWIPLSEYGAQNPGAEPLVLALPEQSNPNQTTVEIELHGFFVRANRSRDGQFDRKFLELSLGSIRESTTQAIGRPAMPQINVMLGIAPDGTVDLIMPEVLATAQFTNARIAPAQPEETEYPNGENFPGAFQMEGSFYEAPGLWPPQQLMPGAGLNPQSPNNWRGMRVGTVNFAPFQAIPSAKILQVATKIRGTIVHPGTYEAPLTLSRLSDRIISGYVLNYWVLMQWGLISSQPDEFIGDYLFIGQEADLLGALDLMRLKQERGYRVHAIRTQDIIDPLDPIHVWAAINNWYNSLEAASEKFVLLIGNEDVIAPAPTSLTKTITTAVDGSEDTVEEEITGISDQRYTCMDSDPYPELGIGRLPLRQSDDLEDYVARARAYVEDPPEDDQYYSFATLVAHHSSEEENSFRECADDIMAASYDDPRGFSYIDGLQDWADNALINNSLDSNLGGVIWYRGHGSRNSWAAWNLQNDPDDENDSSHHYWWVDMNDLLDDPSTSMDGSPIVLSVACSTSKLDSDSSDDWSFGECFMHRGLYSGAIAHIGATRVSNRQKNNSYSKSMWKHLLNDSMYALSIANECSWVSVLDDYAEGSTGYNDTKWNQEVYMLLGDPETRVWHNEPLRLTLELLSAIIPGQVFTSRIAAADSPIEGVILVLSDPVLGPIASGFSDSNGKVTLMMPAGFAGSIDDLVLRAWSDTKDAADVRMELGEDELVGDLNGDGHVDGADLAVLLGAWGTNDPTTDLNGDGTVDGADLAILLGAWTG